MVLQKICPALLGAALLLAGSASMAADYRPEEFLGLDLSTAVLSPKLLGPPTEFAPVPVEANADVKSNAAKSNVAKTDAKTDTKTDAKADIKTDSAKTDHPAHVAQPRVVVSRPAPHHAVAVRHARAEKPRGAARTRLAHRRGNPLDAQALDTRIQTWPCNSGGICNWKQ
jgi:hypothetical protein